MTIHRVIVPAMALLATASSWATPANAQEQEEDAGQVVIVRADDPSHDLERGGSADVFTLRLPPDASCPGDSANDGYRVQTFIMPAADDPGALTYESTKPAGEGRWGLYQPNTRPYVQGLTEMNQGPGQPGRIGGLPVFTFAIYPPELFEDGEYRIGVACTRYNRTERFWHTTIALANDPTDQPAQLRWRATSAPVESEEDSHFGTAVPVLLGIAAASAVLAVALRRSAKADDPPTPAMQRQVR